MTASRETELMTSPGSIRLLESQGYVVLPFLDEQQTEQLLNLHDSLYSSPSHGFFTSAFDTDMARRRKVVDGVRGVIQDKLRLLAPGYRMFFATFVTKKADTAGAGAVRLHQDFTTVDDDRKAAFNIWVPLMDVDERNGCLRVVAGSHRLGGIRADPLNPAPFDQVLGLLEQSYAVDVPMRAGSALVFDSRLLHGSGENVSQRPRFAILCNLVPDGEQLFYHQWNSARPHEVERYAVDDDFFLAVQPNVYREDLSSRGAKLVATVHHEFVMLGINEARRMLPAPTPAR